MSGRAGRVAAGRRWRGRRRSPRWRQPVRVGCATRSALARRLLPRGVDVNGREADDAVGRPGSGPPRTSKRAAGCHGSRSVSASKAPTHSVNRPRGRGRWAIEQRSSVSPAARCVFRRTNRVGDAVPSLIPTQTPAKRPCSVASTRVTRRVANDSALSTSALTRPITPAPVGPAPAASSTQPRYAPTASPTVPAEPQPPGCTSASTNAGSWDTSARVVPAASTARMRSGVVEGRFERRPGASRRTRSPAQAPNRRSAARAPAGRRRRGTPQPVDHRFHPGPRPRSSASRTSTTCADACRAPTLRA